MNILLTGGAGFIGSHTAVELLNAGHDVIIVDNLYNSSAKAVERVEELTGIQSRILENASAGVRKGGVLVYATCSLFERENEKVVLDFLSRHPEFRLEPFRSPDGTECGGMLRTLPMSADCDASFVARIRNLT